MESYDSDGNLVELDQAKIDAARKILDEYKVQYDFYKIDSKDGSSEIISTIKIPHGENCLTNPISTFTVTNEAYE